MEDSHHVEMKRNMEMETFLWYILIILYLFGFKRRELKGESYRIMVDRSVK